MTKLYTEKDVDRSQHTNLKVAILGYGSQGRAHALNLRDSGWTVEVGGRLGGPSAAKAKTDGFTPVTMAEAVKNADVVAMLMPDMAQPETYETQVAPHLKDGALLLFAHGFNVHYQYVDVSKNVDVCLVAPKAPGALVRQQYEEGKGVPCLVAVHQNTTGTALERALAYADGIGGTRAGVLETTFSEETETDLFGEQAVLCGGATELVRLGYEVLVDAGYAPEVAYFECLHELKLIVDLLYEGGFSKLHQFVSETATYGDLTRGPQVVDAQVRENMKAVLKEIQDGTFAREWVNEHTAQKANYQSLLDADLQHPLEEVGAALRQRMAWLSKGDDDAAPHPTLQTPLSPAAHQRHSAS